MLLDRTTKMSSSLSIQRIIKLFWSISKEVRTTNNSAGNLRGRPFSTLLLTIPLSQNGYGSRLREVRAYFLCDPPYTRSRSCIGVVSSLFLIPCTATRLIDSLSLMPFLTLLIQCNHDFSFNTSSLFPLFKVVHLQP